MRIEQLDLLAYGHFLETSLDLSRPAGGLTVVLGPNEAGKSTARRGLAAALFGFPGSSADAFRFGQRGLRVGARLRGADGSSLSYVRQSLSSAPLVDPDGAAVDPAGLERLCGEAGRELFARMFSVDHDELRTASEALLAADGEIGRLVFGAGLGGGSVTQVLAGLEARAEKLFKRNGSKQPVATGFRTYRQAMERARNARVRASEWDSLRREVDEARRTADGIRETLNRARTERHRVDRILAALPLVAERDDELRRLAELDGAASSEWAERTRAALDRHHGARGVLEAAESVHREVAGRLDATPVPGPVLTLAQAVDELTKDVGLHEKAAKDMEARRGDLGEARGELARLLSVLGRREDAGELVPEATLHAVEELAGHHTSLETRLGTAVDELADLDAEIAERRRALAGAPEPAVAGALDRALTVAGPAVAGARSAPERRADAARAEQRVAAEAARLGLPVATLEALAVPSAADISGEQVGRLGRAGRARDLEGHLEDLADRLREVDRREEELRSKPGLPDPGALAVAREHRDEGWRLVRSVLEGTVPDPAEVARWSGGAPVPRAYEEAVAGADRAADARLAHAEDVTGLAQVERRRTELDREVAEARRALDDLRHREEDAARSWRELWAPVGVPAGEPDAMAEWREAFGELVVQAAAARSAAARLAAEDAEAGELAGAVAAELRALGIEPCATRLDLLVAQAREVVDRARRDAEQRSEAARGLEDAESRHPGRLAAVEKVRAELSAWSVSWQAALRPLGLEAHVPPEAARRAVQVHRELLPARKAVADLEARIQGMERDRRTFAERARGVAAELAAAGVALGDPDRTARLVVAELTSLLEQARRDGAARGALESQLEEASVRLDTVRAEAEEAATVLTELREEAGLPPSPDPADGVAAAVQRATDAAACRERLASSERRLLAQGGGRTLEEIVREAAAEDVDRLNALAADLGRQVTALDPDLAAADRRVGQAEGALQAVTEQGTAADVEQEAQESLAQAAAAAAEYARTAVAAAVLRRAIANYGERHRGPILDRAGHLLDVLTRGAFTGLVPHVEAERQVLLARRRNGELRTTGELSDGARDQLYLALRLAGIEHQLDQMAEPLPVVLDDILVNFDDDRAAAGLAALGELAARTQVLLFTHHERVAQAATAALGADRAAVVRLDGRDHGAPISAGTEQAAVLDALAGAPGPWAKAELLAASGIDPARWSAVIGALVDSGDVVREGHKRGARYRLA